MSWQSLIRTGLLGTAKMPLQTATLHPAVQAHLQPHADPEAMFLHAAALTYVYEKAGTLPDQTPLPVLEPAPEETLPVCPNHVSAFVHLMLNNKRPYPDIVLLCLQTIVQKGWVLAPEHLPPLLNLSLQTPFKRLQIPLMDAAGTRGHWLSQFNPQWAFLIPEHLETVWDKGGNAERRKQLLEWRLTHPAQAFERIAQILPEENNSRERKELLSILKINPQPEEWLLIQNLRNEWHLSTNRQKPIHQEINQIATEILLMAPGSTLFNDTTASLGVFVGSKSGLLGLQTKPTLKWPVQPDELSQVALLGEALGMDQHDAQAFFAEMLRLLHPSGWETVFKAPWPDILAALEKTASGGSAHTFLDNLGLALAQAPYQPAVEAYLAAKRPIHASNVQMLDALSPEQLEAFIQQNTSKTIPAYLFKAICRPGLVWSIPFSRHVLNRLTDTQNLQQHYQPGELLQAGMHLHLQTLDLIRQAAEQRSQNQEYRMFHQRFLASLANMMEQRYLIAQF
ncbi:MAG: DUF5691 domain-containing protein [Saprospiraceae bacterium]